MDRYAARLLLTAVMFGAVAVSATLFSDARTQTAGSEPPSAAVIAETEQTPQPNSADAQTAWLVAVRTESPRQTVTVLDQDGHLIGTFHTDADGDAALGPFAPGTYFARSQSSGYVRFSVGEQAEVYAQAGSGWADGERLYLTDMLPSRLELACEAPGRQLVTLTLRDADGQPTERTAHVQNGAAFLVFDGMQAGTYDICLDDTVLRTVKLDGRTSLTLTLPKETAP